MNTITNNPNASQIYNQSNTQAANNTQKVHHHHHGGHHKKANIDPAATGTTQTNGTDTISLSQEALAAANSSSTNSSAK